MPLMFLIWCAKILSILPTAHKMYALFWLKFWRKCKFQPGNKEYCHSLEYRDLNGSIILCLSIHFWTHFAVLETAVGQHDDLSRTKSSTKLKSFPIISWWESMSSSFDSKEFINCSSSTSGVYTFINMIILSKSLPVTITYCLCNKL